MAPVTVHMRYPMTLLVVNGIFMTLATTAVGFRLWARKIRGTKLQFNDYAIIGSLVLTFGLIINLNYAITKGGVAQHQETVSYLEVIFLLKMFVVSSIMWTLSNSVVKISALHFYTTIFPNLNFSRLAYSLMVIIGAYSITYVVATFLICKPFAFNWDKTIPNGKCIDQPSFFLSASLIGLFIDVVIVIMPMPMLWGLNLPLSKRLGLTFMFGMGTLICIITILRAVSNRHLDYNDLPYTSAEDALYTAIEPTLSIINACLPILQPVFLTISTTIKSTFQSRTKSSNNDTSGTKNLQPRDKPFAGSSGAQFERLYDHLYPLSQTGPDGLYGVGTRNEIEASTGYELELTTIPASPKAHPKKSSIAVTKNWNVSSREM